MSPQNWQLDIPISRRKILAGKIWLQRSMKCQDAHNVYWQIKYHVLNKNILSGLLGEKELLGVIALADRVVYNSSPSIHSTLGNVNFIGKRFLYLFDFSFLPPAVGISNKLELINKILLIKSKCYVGCILGSTWEYTKEEVRGNYIMLCHSEIIRMNLLIEILMVKNCSGCIFKQVVTSYTGKVPMSNRYLK